MKSYATLLTLDYTVSSKMRSIEGTLVSSMFCADSRSSQRTPVQAPGSSQLSSKRFPSQRSNHLPNDRPLGAQIQGQVQSRVLGEAGRERRERKRENEGNVGKKEEKWDSKGSTGVGLGRGWTGKLVYWKGGEEVLQPRWWRQRKADEGR